MVDGHGGIKALAGLQRFDRGAAHALKCRNAELGAGRSSPPLSKVGVLEVLLIDRGGKEIEKIGNDRLCALAFQKVDNMVVGKWHVFDEDFADDADARLFERFVDGQRVEILDNAAAELGVAVLGMLARERVDADVAPLAVQRVRAAFFELIRAHAVQAAHQQVTKHDTVRGVQQQ